MFNILSFLRQNRRKSIYPLHTFVCWMLQTYRKQFACYNVNNIIYRIFFQCVMFRIHGVLFFNKLSICGTVREKLTVLMFSITVTFACDFWYRLTIKLYNIEFIEKEFFLQFNSKNFNIFLAFLNIIIRLPRSNLG